jgi:hypothetical protein
MDLFHQLSAASLPGNCKKGSCLASHPALVSLQSDFRHPASPVLPMAAIDKLKSLASRRAADRPSAAAPIVAAPADEDDLPIPADINTVLLGGLFL